MNNYPYFRDWYILEQYTLNFYSISISLFDQILFNFAHKLELNQEFLWKFYSLIWVFVPLLFTYFILYSKYELTKFESSIIVCIYYFNYWVIERLLMGHISVIRGYYLILPFLLIIIKYKTNHKLTSFFCLLMYLVNIHFFIPFALIVCYTKKWKSILIVIPFFIYNSLYQDQFELNFNHNIVNEFSIKNSKFITNIFTNSLIGTGSWMNNSFRELDNIQYTLNFLPYFNQYSAVLYIVLFGYIISKSYKFFEIKFNLLFLTLLVLNIGIINHLFIFFPIYRESGKFYGIAFILFIFYLRQFFIINHSRFIRLVFMVIIISNFVLIGYILPRLNLIPIPYQTVKELNSICSNQKSLFLPNDIYYISPRSRGVFAPNYWFELIDCKLQKPLSTTVGKYQLQNNSNNEKLQKIDWNECERTKIITLEVEYIILDYSYASKKTNILDCLTKNFYYNFINLNELIIFKITNRI